MDYPRAVGPVIPPVNPQLVSRFSQAITQISNDTVSNTRIIRSCNGQNDWAITFDDGPSEFTPRLLQDLKRRNIKATFFVVGVMVRDHPQVLRQVVADGHQVGIHTWSHPHLIQLTNQQIITEIMYTYQIIRDVTGLSCRLVRAPFGEVNGRVGALLEAMGFAIVHWNRDTTDAQSRGVAVKPNVDSWIARRATNIISLQHDLYEYLVQAAPYLMDEAQKANYRLVTIGQCIGASVYGELQTVQPVRPLVSSTASTTTTTTTTASESPTSIASRSTVLPTSSTSEPAPAATTKPANSAKSLSISVSFLFLFL